MQNRKIVLKCSIFLIIWGMDFHNTQNPKQNTDSSWFRTQREDASMAVYLSKFNSEFIKADERTTNEINRLHNSMQQVYKLTCQMTQVLISHRRCRLSFYTSIHRAVTVTILLINSPSSLNTGKMKSIEGYVPLTYLMLVMFNSMKTLALCLKVFVL